VGTPRRHIQKLTADCRHLGLFMGKKVLREMWPDIVHWLIKTPAVTPEGERALRVTHAA
jgi:hypothetical protein